MLKDIVLNKKTYGDAKIAVALSGGRDSVALIHAMKTAGFNIFAVNVEHGIRGLASLSDSRFVSDFCKREGIELKAYSVDAPSFSKNNGYTIEQGARILRYQIFQKLIEEGGCDYVALAHHGGDQTETVFMRIIRGTGVKGLGGMAEVNGKYIRPLLEYSREDIDNYISKNALGFVEDETNADDAYTRNFLRQQISELRKRFPNVDESVMRLTKSAREAEDYISRAAGEPEIDGKEVKIPCAALQEPATAKRLIMKACAALGVFQDVEEKHFDIIFGLKEARNAKRVELTHGVTAHKDGENIVFTRGLSRAGRGFADNSGAETAVEQCTDGKDLFRKCSFLPVEKFMKEKGVLFADMDKIPSDAEFRFRKAGDKFRPYRGGEKSLGDYLTDKKVPLRKRGGLIVLACGNGILAVEGVEISDNIKVDDATKHIVKIVFRGAEKYGE